MFVCTTLLQILINIMIMFPWSLVLLLSFLVNKWQLMFRPIGGLLWYGIDWLDQRMPSLVEWLLWFVYQISLAMHVLTVGINLGVIWVSEWGCRGGAEAVPAWRRLRNCQQCNACGSAAEKQILRCRGAWAIRLHLALNLLIHGTNLDVMGVEF